MSCHDLTRHIPHIHETKASFTLFVTPVYNLDGASRNDDYFPSLRHVHILALGLISYSAHIWVSYKPGPFPCFVSTFTFQLDNFPYRMCIMGGVLNRWVFSSVASSSTWIIRNPLGALFPFSHAKLFWSIATICLYHSKVVIVIVKVGQNGRTIVNIKRLYKR